MKRQICDKHSPSCHQSRRVSQPLLICTWVVVFNNILCLIYVRKSIINIVQNIQVCLKYLLLIFSNYPHTLCTFAFMPFFIPRPRYAIVSTSDIYLVQNLIASSAIYLSTINASGRYGFFTYPLNIFMHLSIGYIHSKNTTRIPISLTR